MFVVGIISDSGACRVGFAYSVSNVEDVGGELTESYVTRSYHVLYLLRYR